MLWRQGISTISMQMRRNEIRARASPAQAACRCRNPFYLDEFLWNFRLVGENIETGREILLQMNSS
jgi:hypothetical protein